MGCVRRLPQIDVCREVQCASVPSEVDDTAMNTAMNLAPCTIRL